eukprot:scaffold966_cov415-Prasinococcus_capsulatus_cf.AAC.28
MSAGLSCSRSAAGAQRAQHGHRARTPSVGRAGRGPIRATPRAEMRLFLDSADAGAWSDYLPSGVFYGVTTNPLILQRDGVRCTRQALTVRHSPPCTRPHRCGGCGSAS